MEVSPDLSNDELVAAVSNDALESFVKYNQAATKTSQRRPKLTDTTKIESIYQQIDILKLSATAVEDLLEYIKVAMKDDTKALSSQS